MPSVQFAQQRTSSMMHCDTRSISGHLYGMRYAHVQLETDQPGLIEPSLPSKACRRLKILGNTSHKQSGGEHVTGCTCNGLLQHTE
ncbi:unnamed protein product [Penicillium roqueforti FM164]|uniref:Genomic scaffold, ProqFM164S01 n=1 Tax=Penicillium roqueforti (strain FM164) TaxID=1365484 RepID=W6PZ82_PENRF|nr:unnamed protein product [Penicillium roqueforti FM164]